MAGPRPLLIVDDDAALRATLAEQLSLDGEFEPAEASTAEEPSRCSLPPTNRFDAVLLDIGLPDGDGRELCTRLRRQGLKIPVIMLTGADGEQDVVRGLDAGANDYIAKPSG
jgi:DNA-binding response OmpR family regulator